MTSFAHPLLLWSLTGMAVPLAIHLLSRKQAVILYAGSLRHFSFSFSKQFKSLRLNELLLLILRMLMILLLTLAAAGIRRDAAITTHKRVFFEEGTENDPQVAAVADSLTEAGYEAHYLADGFPVLQKSSSSSSSFQSILKKETAAGNTGYWEFADAITDQSLADAVIFYRQRASRFKGHRIAVPARQRWIPVDEASVLSYPLEAIRSGDSLVIRTGRSDADVTEFTNIVEKNNPALRYFKLGTDSVSIAEPRRISYHFVTDPGFENDESIFRSVIGILRQKEIVTVETAKPAGADLLIWLSERPAPASGFLIVIQYHAQSGGSVLKKTSPAKWELTSHLSTAIALETNLTLQVGRILKPESDFLPIVNRNDRRQMPASIWAPSAGTGEIHAPPASTSAAGSLMILFLVVLVFERIAAWNKNQ